MASSEFNISVLKQKQSLSLEAKIVLTQKRIKEWYDHWDGQVYLSFSGGKDSTVLKHIIENTPGICDVPDVFVNTGLEYPEIQKFVRNFDDITIIKPDKSFKQVIEQHGYPIISKEIARTVEEARKSLESGKTQYLYSLKKLEGVFKDKEGNYSMYNCPKWHFLIDAPFKISKKCCHYLKRKPILKYQRETKRKPFLGTLAVESLSRRMHWINYGCNGFKMRNPISNPLSFWTEQDILQYIDEYKIPYCEVYGEILRDENGKYFLTKLDRTGCMFCMFGIQRDKNPNRFQRMKGTHPNQYKYCMEDLGIKDVLSFLNIEYD